MADPVAFAALRASIQNQTPGAWNTFRESHHHTIDLTQADLSGLALRDFNLSGVDLLAAILNGADLQGTRLVDARLAYADMGRVNLARADATRCDLLCAHLEGANLVETRLTRACLRGAMLDGGYVIGADCNGADFSNARFRGTKLKSLDLRQARLSGADMEEAELIDVALTADMVARLLHFDRTVVRSSVATAPGGPLAPPCPKAPPTGDDHNPWTLLGLQPGAAIRDIATAYRRKAKEYHPDRVAGLGEKIRQLAHCEFVRLQHAYQTLMSEIASPMADITRADGTPYDPESLTAEDYLRLLDSDPDNPLLRFNLGVKYLEAGHNRRAAEAFAETLRLAPDHEDARYNLKLARLLAGLQGDGKTGR